MTHIAILSLCLVSTLFLSCSSSGSQVPTENNTSPAVIREHQSQQQDQSPFELPAESEAKIQKQLPTGIFNKEVEYDDDNRGSCASLCLSDFYALYSAWYNLAQLQRGQFIESCRSITVKDKAGRIIFRARLHDNCRMDIRYEGEGIEIDTSFFIK